jgi:Protein of unknown function (DUF3990)
MPWNNGRLTLYHGTVGPYADDIAKNGIQVAKGNDKTDFGRGFYMTRILAQAIRFANQKYAELNDDYLRFGKPGFDPERAAVVEVFVDYNVLGGMDTLAFVQPTPDWKEFISHCRLPSCGHKGFGNYYQVVYGPPSATVDGIIPDCEQLSVHTDYAATLLSVVPTLRYGGPMLLAKRTR